MWHDMDHRSKHIDRRHFFVREMVEQMRLEVPYVNTTENEADFFTKALPSKTFHAMRDVIMNVPVPQREGHSLKAFLSHRRAPVTSPDLVPRDESPHALWSRLFDAFAPEYPEDAPDGVEQRVYWVDGDEIVRVCERTVGGPTRWRVQTQRVRCTGGC